MIEKFIEQLLIYAKKNLDLEGYDIVYSKNLIMQLLNVYYPYKDCLTQKEIIEIEDLNVPDTFINYLCNYIKENKLANEGMELSFASLIMAILSPSPQAVAEKFYNLIKKKGIKKACNYLYNLSIKNNYIQKTAIDKNIKWRADFEENFLEITINLSKPEKNNKDILKQLNSSSKTYPKCMLCIENLGFEGNISKPPRQNIRFVPIKLCDEKWFVQYSPYQYYNEHCIAISENHHPMSVNKKTIEKLADFVDVFPYYFIGSNASLPIVGGSILSHEHFQGGGHKMPLHYAEDKKVYVDTKDIKISSVNWYNSVIRIVSDNKNNLFNVAGKVFDLWQNYNDDSCNIVSFTKEQHNAITPIMRKENNKYILELILRNNRTNEKYPDGIFHAHPKYHNIKKEGIGLIEAMGLFILPARLKRQTDEIKNILCGKRKYDEDLLLHKNMIEYLQENNKNNLTEKEADFAVKDYINDTCKNILINTAVFKSDEKGQKAFDNFINNINW